jgi:hypothetical protein
VQYYCLKGTGTAILPWCSYSQGCYCQFNRRGGPPGTGMAQLAQVPRWHFKCQFNCIEPIMACSIISLTRGRIGASLTQLRNGPLYLFSDILRNLRNLTRGLPPLPSNRQFYRDGICSIFMWAVPDSFRARCGKDQGRIWVLTPATT